MRYVWRAEVGKEAAGSWINWGSIKCDIKGPQTEVLRLSSELSLNPPQNEERIN